VMSTTTEFANSAALLPSGALQHSEGLLRDHVSISSGFVVGRPRAAGRLPATSANLLSELLSALRQQLQHLWAGFHRVDDKFVAAIENEHNGL